MPSGVPFRRILVGVDASPASVAASTAAATLAARLRAELRGLFVEDEDLLRLAALPFAGVVLVPSGAREPLDLARAEAELRAVAAHAREALARAAAQVQASFEFTVRRGRVVPEILAASGGVDLLVLGAGGRRRSGRAGLGDTARAAAERAPSSVLLLGGGARAGDPVIAVDDGGPGGALAVEVARALAGSPGASVLVAPPSSTAELPAGLARLEAGLVVVSAGGRLASGPGLDALLAHGAAALVVRRGPV
jgi:nucleotide-binding universal stress UspA family protein